MKLKIRKAIILFIIIISASLVNHTAMATEIGNIIIDENTLWDLTGSPYNISGEVQIEEGVTLTIQPGVVVNGGAIKVWGTFNAIGIATSKVFINNVWIGPPQAPSNATINIKFAEITGPNRIYCEYGFSLTLEDSIIRNTGFMNVKLPGNDCYIERNVFIDAEVIQTELRGSNRIYIRNNVFYQPAGSPAISNSHDADSSEVIIEYNSFLSTDRINLWVGTGSHPVNITAINNYWNTTDTDVIDDMIYDRKDDVRCSVEIVYEPFLTAPHPNTPVFPTANFSADTTIGLPPLTVIFTDESIGPIDSWEWDFGDSSTSNQQDPIHTYENLGRYTVSLNVGGPIASDTVVKTDYITVGDAPDLVGKCKEFHSYEFGERVIVKVEVENTGTEKASRFNVAFFLSDDGTTRNELLELNTVMGGLNAQHTKVVSLRYDSEILLSGKYIITVIDPDLQVLEFDETDNEFATRIP